MVGPLADDWRWLNNVGTTSDQMNVKMPLTYCDAGVIREYSIDTTFGQPWNIVTNQYCQHNVGPT